MVSAANPETLETREGILGKRENGKIVIDNLPWGCYPAACRCEEGDGSECGTSLVSN
jgi:hypothetical protein